MLILIDDNMYFKQLCGFNFKHVWSGWKIFSISSNQVSLTCNERPLILSEWLTRQSVEMHSDLKIKIKIDCWLTGVIMVAYSSYHILLMVSNYDLSPWFLPIVEQLIFWRIAPHNKPNKPDLSHKFPEKIFLKLFTWRLTSVFN